MIRRNSTSWQLLWRQEQLHSVEMFSSLKGKLWAYHHAILDKIDRSWCEVHVLLTNSLVPSVLRSSIYQGLGVSLHSGHYIRHCSQVARY
jgi:hypothetical protein